MVAAPSTLTPQEAEVTFARDLHLFDATTLGIGAMIGAGIFDLTGIAAGEAGPAALLAFALNGLVTLLTALSYAELASVYPKSGGGYSFIVKAFPGPAGFASGWMLWFCYIIACALYALGFGSYFWGFIQSYFPSISNLVFNSETAANFTPFLPNGAGGVVIAMGLTFIAFEGYDLIATVAEEIKAPEKTIPRATLISLGGLISTISALNATILASSRVAFSMSRDKMLPRSLSKIHAQRRTPHIAIGVAGAIIIVMALLFPIQVIGSAASVMFLLTFALVNLSLIALRRKFPELKGGFRVPLYPATPIAAIGLNLFLAVYQFNFDPRAWYIALAWIIVGLFIYFMYFEKTAAVDMPQTLEVQQPKSANTYPYRVLVPLHNPDHVIPLMKPAIPIAKAQAGEIIVLGVIDLPINLPPHEGMRFVHHKTPLMKKAIEYGNEQGVETRSAIRIAHRSGMAFSRWLKRKRQLLF